MVRSYFLTIKSFQNFLIFKNPLRKILKIKAKKDPSPEEFRE